MIPVVQIRSSECGTCGAGFIYNHVGAGRLRRKCFVCQNIPNGRPTTITCECCGETKRHPNMGRRLSRFCSPKCRRRHHYETTLVLKCKRCGSDRKKSERWCSACRKELCRRQCETCQSGFFAPAPSSQRRYCSLTCTPAFGRGVERSDNCRTCGQEITTKTCGIQACESCRDHNRQMHNARKRQTRRRAIATAPERFSRREIFDRDGWRCLACKRPVRDDIPHTHPRKANLDHIIPLSAGGVHERRNCQTLCRECNTRKGQRGIDQLRLVG